MPWRLRLAGLRQGIQQAAADPSTRCMEHAYTRLASINSFRPKTRTRDILLYSLLRHGPHPHPVHSCLTNATTVQEPAPLSKPHPRPDDAVRQTFASHGTRPDASILGRAPSGMHALCTIQMSHRTCRPPTHISSNHHRVRRSRRMVGPPGAESKSGSIWRALQNLDSNSLP